MSLVACGLRQAPAPAGSWTTVRSGTYPQFKWSLWTTPPQKDGQCLAVEAQPPLTSQLALPPSALYRGKVANCLLRPGLGSSSYVSVVYQPEGLDGITILMGRTSDAVVSVRASFATSTVAIGTSDHYFLIVFPAEDRLPTLEPLNSAGVVLKHCPPNLIASVAIFRC